MKSNFKWIVGNVNSILREQGYANCKVVGRGSACQLTEEVINHFERVTPYYKLDIMKTRALNKVGDVVDELHLLISKKGQSAESGNQTRYPRDSASDYHKNGQFEANSNSYRQPR